MTGSQEVTGSSPVISTNEKRTILFGLPVFHSAIQKEITGLEGERADHREAKTVRWDTLHKEGVPPDYDNSGFTLFSSVSVAFLPYGVGSLLPYLRD